MSDATLWKDYDEWIQCIIKDALIELGEIINDMVKKQIEEDVYDYGDARATMYTPSWDFYESYQSIDITKNPQTPEVLITSIGDEMELDAIRFRHGSEYKVNGTTVSTDVREYLSEILAFNLSGDLFGSNMWFHNRPSYFYNVLEKLESGGFVSKKFRALLKKRGLTIGK